MRPCGPLYAAQLDWRGYRPLKGGLNLLTRREARSASLRRNSPAAAIPSRWAWA